MTEHTVCPRYSTCMVSYLNRIKFGYRDDLQVKEVTCISCMIVLYSTEKMHDSKYGPHGSVQGQIQVGSSTCTGRRWNSFTTSPVAAVLVQDVMYTFFPCVVRAVLQFPAQVDLNSHRPLDLRLKRTIIIF